MLWRRAAQPQPPRPAAPVPEGESVRLAALQAAWRRDRWVARRRIWLRWTLWGAQRYGVPAVGALGVMAGLWFAVRATLGWVEAPSPTDPMTASAQSSPVPKTAVAAIAVGSKETPPITVSNAHGMPLKFDRSMHPVARSETPVSSPASSEAAETPNPQLISENWLHSKEP